MEFMIGLGLGWGLGIAFSFQLSKMLWPDQQNIWDKHREAQQRAEQIVRSKR
jgi:hypothetical protein